MANSNMTNDIEKDVEAASKRHEEKLKANRERSRNASQWYLMWSRFKRHKLAVVALVILGCFYIVVVFAEVIAPYDPNEPNRDSANLPPQIIRFVDDGKFRMRPYVYGYTTHRDPETLEMIYEFDPEQKYRIRVLCKGSDYKLWGLIPGNIHLFGTDRGSWSVFGTDYFGRDVFSRIVYGTRISLSIGLIGVAISLVIGVSLGGISGYFGGKIDTVIQRVIELLRSIPTLPLWMGLSAALPRDWSTLQLYFAITLILSIIGWTGVARVVRGKFLSLRSEEFVLASKNAGAGAWWIITRHLIPTFSGYIMVSVTLAIPRMILGETALSFLGLGLRAPAISWGVLLKQAQDISVITNYPWRLLVGPFIVIAVLAFNFVGDALRDAADPYESRRM